MTLQKARRISESSCLINSDMEKVDGRPVAVLCRMLKSVSVELILLFFIFSYFTEIATSQRLVIDKVCLVHYNFSSDVCSNLSNYSALKTEVERTAGDYILYINLIRMLPAALLSIFVGPWSDKYGRKLPLKIGLIGVLLDALGLVGNTIYYGARVEYILLTSAFWGLSGGMTSVLTAVYSCASDLSSESGRAFQYARLEFVFGSGVALGNIVGGVLYDYYGYLTVFTMASTAALVSLLLSWFVLSETRRPEKEEKRLVLLSAFFSTESIRTSLKTLMVKRQNHGRALIFLLLGSISAIIITYASIQNVAYMFTYHMYNWDVAMYSAVTAVTTALSEVTMVITVPLLTRVLKVGDCALGLLGTVSMIAQNVGKAVASKEYVYYIACVLGLFNAVGPLAVRSRLSKVVKQDDRGKIFAFVSSCESLFPMLASALFTLVFNATLDTLPGLVYLLSAGLLVLPLFVFSWQILSKPRRSDECEGIIHKEDSCLKS